MATIVETINGVLFSNSVIIDGIVGNGYIQLTDQISTPISPSGAANIYAVGGGVAYQLADGFVRNIQMPASADRTYTIPNVASSSFVMTQGNSIINGTITATNLSGNNSGDITLGAVGVVPNANSATLTGQVLNLQPANVSFPGVITVGAQTLAGAKTFTNSVTTNGNFVLPATTSAAGAINIAGARFLHRYGTDNVFLGSFSGNFSLTGTDNVCIGSATGASLTTGSDNIFVGPLAGSNIITGQNNIVIGDPNTTEGSNRLILGNALTTAAFMQGIVGNVAPAANNPRLLTIDPTNSRIYSSGSSGILTTISTTCSLIADASSINGVNATYTWGTYNIAGGQLTWTSSFNVMRVGKMVFVFLPSFMINNLSANTLSYTYTNFIPALPIPQASTHPVSQILSIAPGNTTSTSSGNAELTITGGIILQRNNTTSTFRDNGVGSGLIRPAIFIYEAT